MNHDQYVCGISDYATDLCPGCADEQWEKDVSEAKAYIVIVAKRLTEYVNDRDKNKKKKSPLNSRYGNSKRK